MIDPHVHLRDFRQKDGESVLHGLTVASYAGFKAVFDMPNTDPPLTGEDAVKLRLELKDRAEKALSHKINYHMFLGLTADEKQIEEVVCLYKRYFPIVIGLKLFLSHSTGNMGIVSRADQEKVIKTLTSLKYTGVVALHAEKESLMENDKYVQGFYETHSLARPEKSETEAIDQILEISRDAGFAGKLHFCHVSTIDGIELIESAKRENSNIALAVTPHHALLSTHDAENRELYLKMNPPLRSEDTRAFVYKAILDGKVDFIESDHAPHLLSDKENGASGIPGFRGMLLLLKNLINSGVEKDRLEALFGGNINKFYGLDEKIELPSTIDERLEALKFSYNFDPYRGL